MANDVDDLFTALAADAGRARLAPAATIRRRADRGTLARSAAGALALVLLAGGVAAGLGPDTGRWLSAAPAYSRIPDSAFLQRADWPYGVLDGPDRIPVTRTDGGTECDRAPEPGLIEAEGATTLTYAERSGSGAPAGSVVEKVFVFGGDGARGYLDAFRAAVPACPVHGLFVRAVAGDLGRGDDSVLIEVSSSIGNDGQPAPSLGSRRSFQAVVRHGDRVAVVHVRGEQDRPVARDDAIELARAASARLAAWPG